MSWRNAAQFLFAATSLTLSAAALAQYSIPAPAPVTPEIPESAKSPLFAQQDRLQSAIVKRDLASVREFIRAGMDLNFNFNDLYPRGRTHESPLTMAVNRGHLDIARLLLESGADARRRDAGGRAPVHQAKSADAVRLLVQFGADPNAQDSTGRTAAVNALERGDLQALDMLLANGARLDAEVKGADLFTRAIQSRHPELIGALLDRGVDPRTPPTQALWLLIESGDTERARRLIRAGADVNARNDRDWLLTRALFRKRWEIAETLVDAGASVRLPDAPGCGRLAPDCASIQLARQASYNAPLLAKLKAKGLDLDAAGADGHSALSLIISEQPMAIRAVSGGGVAIAAHNPATGETVTRSVQPPATVRDIPAPDNVARTRTLLQAGANPNRKYRDLTPLMLAIALPNKPREMADALLDSGGRIEFERTIPKAATGELPLPLTGGATLSDAASETLLLSLSQNQGIFTGMSVGPLTWAALQSRPDVALRLLERDKKAAPSDRDLLYFAALLKQWDLVIAASRFSKQANASDRAGVTPLMLAAQAGRADAVKVLLAAGAKVNARSALHWPPLLERNLLDALGGHSSRPPLVGGYTALRAAKERGHAEAQNILIEAGGRE